MRGYNGERCSTFWQNAGQVRAKEGKLLGKKNDFSLVCLCAGSTPCLTKIPLEAELRFLLRVFGYCAFKP